MPMEQSVIWLPLGTAVVGGIVIFVTAFLLGVFVGHRWRR